MEERYARNVYLIIFINSYRSVKNAKIACLDFSLQKAKMKMGVQVLVTDPEELEKIRDRESDITKERIKKILGKWINSDFFIHLWAVHVIFEMF